MALPRRCIKPVPRVRLIRVDRILIQAQQKARVKGAKEVARLGGYLMENSFGLRDYRLEVGGDGLRGLGAIEDNVNKLVANRWSWRFNSMIIRDSHRPIVDSNGAIFSLTGL